MPSRGDPRHRCIFTTIDFACGHRIPARIFVEPKHHKTCGASPEDISCDNYFSMRHITNTKDCWYCELPDDEKALDDWGTVTRDMLRYKRYGERAAARLEPFIAKYNKDQFDKYWKEGEWEKSKIIGITSLRSYFEEMGVLVRGEEAEETANSEVANQEMPITNNSSNESSASDNVDPSTGGVKTADRPDDKVSESLDFKVLPMMSKFLPAWTVNIHLREPTPTPTPIRSRKLTNDQTLGRSALAVSEVIVLNTSETVSNMSVETGIQEATFKEEDLKTNVLGEAESAIVNNTAPTSTMSISPTSDQNPLAEIKMEMGTTDTEDIVPTSNNILTISIDATEGSFSFKLRLEQDSEEEDDIRSNHENVSTSCINTVLDESTFEELETEEADHTETLSGHDGDTSLVEPESGELELELEKSDEAEPVVVAAVASQSSESKLENDDDETKIALITTTDTVSAQLANGAVVKSQSPESHLEEQKPITGSELSPIQRTNPAAGESQSTKLKNADSGETDNGMTTINMVVSNGDIENLSVQEISVNYKEWQHLDVARTSDVIRSTKKLSKSKPWLDFFLVALLVAEQVISTSFPDKNLEMELKKVVVGLGSLALFFGSSFEVFLVVLLAIQHVALMLVPAKDVEMPLKAAMVAMGVLVTLAKC